MEEEKITILSFSCSGCRRWNCHDFCMGPGGHYKDEEGNDYNGDLSKCIIVDGFQWYEKKRQERTRKNTRDNVMDEEMMEVPLPRFRLMEKEFPNSDFHESWTEFVKRIKDFFPDGGNEKKIFKWIISISRYFDAKKRRKNIKKIYGCTGLLIY